MAQHGIAGDIEPQRAGMRTSGDKRAHHAGDVAFAVAHRQQQQFGLQWLATETALASGSLTPMGSLARSLYLQQQRRGRGRIDFSSIQQLYSEPAD